MLKELKNLAEVKHECNSKTNLTQVFNDPELEAVFIATPTETHFKIASQSLDASKHTFLEKPGTANTADLEKLVNKAKKKRLKFAVGYEFPHHSAVQKIKELIQDNKIEFIRLEYQKWGTFKDSIVTNLLCHDVSILKYLGIETSSPTAYKIGVVTEADILETRFGHGAISIINRANPTKQRMMLVKTLRESYLWNDNELFEVAGDELKKIELPETTPVALELTDFISAIQHNREPLINGEFALEISKIIERIRFYQS